MSRPHQLFWLAALVAGNFFIFSLDAENSANNLPLAKKNSAAPNLLPIPQSPVDFFRRLLVMSPLELQNFLATKPPEARARILDKIREYQSFDPDERELRLRATELHWYLMPLLHDAPTNRDEQIALVPEDLRDLIKARLIQWDILPPPLQQEFLENESALEYFANVEATNYLPSTQIVSQPNNEEQIRWNALPDNARKMIAAQFNQFFELTPDEKQKTLNTLSDAERAQMEKTLQSFQKLPSQQRRECVQAFTKFAEMSPQDRVEFLKNAQSWSRMSPEERQTWRDLVAHIPLFPTAVPPPLPSHSAPQISKASLDTN